MDTRSRGSWWCNRLLRIGRSRSRFHFGKGRQIIGPEKQALAGTWEANGFKERVLLEKRGLLTLVIPTRNEADNISCLIRELEEHLAGVNYRVVFVDDSTDETPEVIRTLSEKNGRISLIHRVGAERDGGLSTAVAAGIDAVANDSEYTCVMDADLQHPPRKCGRCSRRPAPRRWTWW